MFAFAILFVLIAAIIVVFPNIKNKALYFKMIAKSVIVLIAAFFISFFIFQLVVNFS